MSSSAEAKEVEAEEIIFKPGQKHATPAPGNGGMVELFMFKRQT